MGYSWLSLIFAGLIGATIAEFIDKARFGVYRNALEFWTGAVITGVLCFILALVVIAARGM